MLLRFFAPCLPDLTKGADFLARLPVKALKFQGFKVKVGAVPLLLRINFVAMRIRSQLMKVITLVVLISDTNCPVWYLSFTSFDCPYSTLF
jgi:hypothetical protein